MTKLNANGLTFVTILYISKYKPPKQCLNAVFGEKIPMAKGKKVLTFCLWLNRAANGVVLGRSMNLFIFDIPLSKL